MQVSFSILVPEDQLLYERYATLCSMLVCGGVACFGGYAQLREITAVTRKI